MRSRLECQCGCRRVDAAALLLMCSPRDLFLHFTKGPQATHAIEQCIVEIDPHTRWHIARHELSQMRNCFLMPLGLYQGKSEILTALDRVRVIRSRSTDMGSE